MKRMGKKEVARLWVEFKRTGAKEYFDTIVETYLPLVRYTAERIWGKLPRGVELHLYGVVDVRHHLNVIRLSPHVFLQIRVLYGLVLQPFEFGVDGR